MKARRSHVTLPALPKVKIEFRKKVTAYFHSPSSKHEDYSSAAQAQCLEGAQHCPPAHCQSIWSRPEAATNQVSDNFIGSMWKHHQKVKLTAIQDPSALCYDPTELRGPYVPGPYRQDIYQFHSDRSNGEDRRSRTLHCRIANMVSRSAISLESSRRHGNLSDIRRRRTGDQEHG